MTTSEFFTLRKKSLTYWVSLFCGVIVLIGGAFTAVEYSSNCMKSTADQRFDQRLRPALRAPDGAIYETITDVVEDHEARVEKQYREDRHEFDKRMQRQELMLREVYTAVIGREPPPM